MVRKDDSLRDCQTAELTGGPDKPLGCFALAGNTGFELELLPDVVERSSVIVSGGENAWGSAVPFTRFTGMPFNRVTTESFAENVGLLDDEATLGSSSRTVVHWLEGVSGRAPDGGTVAGTDWTPG